MTKKLITCAVSILFCMSQFAWAEHDIHLDEVDVTAKRLDATILPLDLTATSGSRLGLTVQETPASIEVITKDLMRERGHTTTEQALGNAVGVLAGQCFGLTCFSMRGFSGTTSLPFLYNGLRYPGLAISPRNTFNYDRIEVIKGPSSVLHGLGATTGAVNFVSKAADGHEEKEVLVAYDTWGAKTVGLGIGGKIADTEKSAYRADISYKGANKGSYGFVDNSSYDSVHFTGELALQVLDNFKVTLSEEWYQDNGEGYFGTPHINGKIVRSTRDENYNVSNDDMNKEVNWTRLNLEWTPADKVKVRNETYYNNENRYWKNAEVYAYNATTGRVDRSDFLNIKHDQELIGNRTEFTLDHMLGSMRNRILFGYDISRNEHQRDNNSPFSSPANSVDLLDPEPGVFITNSPFLPFRRTELLQRAFFVEDYLNLTDQFKVSLSGRHDALDLDSINLRPATATNPAIFHKHYSGNSYRVGALYDILPALTLYGQFSSALEPPSQVVTLTYAQKDFDLTRAKQKEVGVKGSLPDNLGEVTLSLFDIERTNVLTRDPLNSTLTVQIGEQSSKGVELSAVLRPSDKWTVEGNASVLDAQFDKFFERVSGVGVSRAGNVPPDVPEKIANLWLTYRPNGDWRIGAGAHFVGQRAGDNANTPTKWMDGYTTYDALVGYKLGKGELMFTVRNLTDKLYANRSYGGGGQFMLGEPRAAEISWHAAF